LSEFVKKFDAKWVVAAAVMSVASQSAFAAGTAAGTAINNTAQVSYDDGGTTVNTSSNPTTLTVAEIINVNTTVQTPNVTVSPGAASRAVVVRVTNTGNAPETFRLTGNSAIAGDNFDPAPAVNMIYFDIDGSGDLSAADTVYTAGANDPTLAADASINLLIINNIPSGLTNGQTGVTQLTAVSLTGTGAPGTVFAGQGESSTDAVLGTSGGTSGASGSYVVSSVQINAVKTQVVVDQFGGTQPIPGARIDYQIVVTPSGSGTASNVLIVDGIPTNTTYLPSTLRLNGAVQTDAGDTDSGSFVTAPAPAVRVNLGNLTQASGAQTVAFSVTIN
jgi:uncharacterized repeat protein (TIGR01451 family)